MRLTEMTDDMAQIPSENSPLVQEEQAHGQIKFNSLHWASTGIVRLLYRTWTRIAAHLFPEGSQGEQIAHTLHIPLPDQLNLSWITDHLAVGGRIRPEDIQTLGL